MLFKNFLLLILKRKYNVKMYQIVFEILNERCVISFLIYK